MTQPPASDFDRISPTAFMTSLARQFTDIPYAKDLAQLIAAQRLARLPLILEARYKAIDQAAAQYDITQILELASGFLPRGLAMSAIPDVTFIETDLPAVIHCKRNLAQQLVGERANLHFLEMDATGSPNPLLQCADYFKKDQPVMVLCEGLLMYLTRAEQRQVCANVREMLQLYGGVWITPDFTATVGLRQSVQDNRELRGQVMATANITGRSLADNAFDTIDQARQFAREQGFRVAEYDMSSVLDQLSCLEVLSIDTETASGIVAAQRIFALNLDAA